MLRRLHLRLTLLYVLAGLALIALVAGGAYRLLGYYFERTTDLALQYRMGLELAALGAPVPGELSAAGTAWQANQVPLLRPAGSEPSEGNGGEHGDEHQGSSGAALRSEDAYDGELAAIFVMPLGADGTLLFNPNPVSPPLTPDRAAAAAALAQGHDWRTVALANGTRVRLLTYRLSGAAGSTPALLQLGRSLDDQDRLLSSLLVGLLALGGAGLALLAASSWWLAGRSLVPAQQAWERQQAFVANASHELRTPLTLIRASAEVAQRSLPAGAGDDAAALLDDVLRECDHTGRLVDDLLLLSRLDAGRLAVEHEPVVLSDLFADVGRQMGRLAEARGVQLLTGAGGAVALADAARLRQVLLILLDNALRHTPAGGTVRVDAQAERRQVHVRVGDTGTGIEPEHLPHVFERFYRADGARGHGGGAGLGLAIAKALVEAQHGHIAIASRPGEGTEVTVTLPAAAPAAR